MLDGDLWGGYESFRRWNLAEGSMPLGVGGYVISQFPVLDTCCHASPDIMDFLYGTVSQSQLFLRKSFVVTVFYYTQQ